MAGGGDEYSLGARRPKFENVERCGLKMPIGTLNDWRHKSEWGHCIEPITVWLQESFSLRNVGSGSMLSKKGLGDGLNDDSC